MNMTKLDLIKYCLKYDESYADYPFGENIAVIMHKSNKKMFSLISEKDNTVYINLKCGPLKADFFRSAFKSVTPGYHMNKTHWNTITMQSDMTLDVFNELVAHSYELVKPKQKK